MRNNLFLPILKSGQMNILAGSYDILLLLNYGLEQSIIRLFSFFLMAMKIFSFFYEPWKCWKCVFAKSGGIHVKTKLFNTMKHLYLEKLISYCKDFLNVKKGQVWKYNLIKEIDLDICYSKTTLLSVDAEWCEIRALLVVFSLEAVQCTYTVCPFDILVFIILWIKQLPKLISPITKRTFNY